MKIRTFTSARIPYRLAVHPCPSEPGRWQLTKLDADESPVGHTTWATESHAVKSALGRRVRGQAAVGTLSYVEEVASDPYTAIGWLEYLRREGREDFSTDDFLRYFADSDAFDEPGAVILLWNSAGGLLWSWNTLEGRWEVSTRP